MKKVFLSALLIAGLGSVFTSCNNGPYDADPKMSNGTVLNPLNPESGVTIPIGIIRMEINGYIADFNTSIWTDSVAGAAIISGTRYDTATQVQGFTIYIAGYNGVGTYAMGPDGSGGSITHILYNPLDNNYIGLGFISAIGTGSGTVTIEGTEDGHLRGKFEGTLCQNAPVVDVNNKEVITKGQFYVWKHGQVGQ
ncbi:MAG: hypothetical protein JNL72_11205 [Flavipsychrobacter sp.]|nr:hypothetical protein [Flavipsychrobacter sp.]